MEQKFKLKYLFAIILRGIFIRFSLYILLGAPVFVNAQAIKKSGKTYRERISINSGWKFMRYTSEPDKFIYNERPEVSNHNDNTVADTRPADYQQMLDQLHIKRNEMRPGASGNPNVTNAAYRFEEKVNQNKLPDPLVLNNGKKITTAADRYQKHRPEIADLFNREINERVPKNALCLKRIIISIKDTTNGNYKAKEKILKGIVDNTSFPDLKVEIDLQLVVPGNANGKATVVAMAYESRFSSAFVGYSGAKGTMILRRVFGEKVESFAS